MILGRKLELFVALSWHRTRPSTVEVENRWMKIEDAKRLGPSQFLEEKRSEFQDYKESSVHRVKEKGTL